jgi:hypothetical protein
MRKLVLIPPDSYSPKDIVNQLEMGHTAGSLAATVAAFWPTIRAALLAYDKITHSRKVRPIPSGD